MSYGQIISLASIPIIAGFIGWLTNKIALFMLFRPRKETSIAGVKLQGVIPRRQPEIASAIANTISTHLVNQTAIEQEISKPEVHEALLNGLMDYGRRYIAECIGGLPGPVRVVVTATIEDQMTRRLRKEAEEHLPKLMQEVAPALASNVDFRARIEKEIAGYPAERLEGMIREIAGRELRSIEIWGGVLGFIIGLIQVVIVLVTK